jgi:predicted DNA-binding transcriptional regulator AlpA
MDKQKNKDPQLPLEPRLGQVLGKIGEALEQAIRELRLDLQRELTKVRDAMSEASESGDDRKGLLTVNELCKRASVSRSHLYRWLGDPKNRFFEDGIAIRLPGGGKRGRLRFRWSAFESWLLSR